MRSHLLGLCSPDISASSQIWFQDIFHQGKFFLGGAGAQETLSEYPATEEWRKVGSRWMCGDPCSALRAEARGRLEISCYKVLDKPALVFLSAVLFKILRRRPSPSPWIFLQSAPVHKGCATCRQNSAL